MTSPDFDLPYRSVITEIDLAQRAVKDLLGRNTDPNAPSKVLTLLQGQSGDGLARVTLERLLYEQRIEDMDQISLPANPVATFRRELIRRWESYFALPETEQQVLRESARKEFFSTRNR